MISQESIQYSLKNLKHKKTRSFLTILSIFIGIATIFIFISFGLGLYHYIEDISSNSSANKVLIQAKGIGLPGLDSSFQLTDDDLEAVKKTAGVKDASGVYFDVAEITQDNIKKYTFVISYDPAKPLMMDTFNINIEKGRDLRPREKNKIVVGYNYQIPKKIFPKPYSINDKLELNGKKIRIVGFYEEIGSPRDDAQIYVTNEYFKELYPNTTSYSYIVASVETKKIEKVIEEIEKNLRRERDLKKGKEDFFVQSYKDLIETYSSALDIVIGFIILIALISIVVSTINTSNTMITSVLERVKEIGIMKAIGARNSDIFKIFLFESGFLGFVAGIIGVILGWGTSLLGAKILDNLGWGFLSPYFPWELFIGLILFATITGAISGMLPAIKASKINPVDALKYE